MSTLTYKVLSDKRKVAKETNIIPVIWTSIFRIFIDGGGLGLQEY